MSATPSVVLQGLVGGQAVAWNALRSHHLQGITPRVERSQIVKRHNLSVRARQTVHHLHQVSGRRSCCRHLFELSDQFLIGGANVDTLALATVNNIPIVTRPERFVSVPVNRAPVSADPHPTHPDPNRGTPDYCEGLGKGTASVYLGGRHLAPARPFYTLVRYRKDSGPLRDSPTSTPRPAANC